MGKPGQAQTPIQEAATTESMLRGKIRVVKNKKTTTTTTKNLGICKAKRYDYTPAPVLTSCVTLGKTLNLSEPHLLSGENVIYSENSYLKIK